MMYICCSCETPVAETHDIWCDGCRRPLHPSCVWLAVKPVKCYDDSGFPYQDYSECTVCFDCLHRPSMDYAEVPMGKQGD